MKYETKYTLINLDGGYQIQYFCALCDYSYTTGWVLAQSRDEALRLTEKEARKHFNGCHECGRWVCDEHYNMDAMICVECFEKYK